MLAAKINNDEFDLKLYPLIDTKPENELPEQAPGTCGKSLINTTKLRLLHTPRLIIEIIKKIRLHQPDVVHVHSFLTMLFAKIADTLLWRRRPFIIHIGKTRWNASIDSFFTRLSTKWIMDKAVANSESVKSFLVNSGVNPDKIVVIPNGHRIEAYSEPFNRDEVRTALGLKPDDFVFVTTGRLVGLKRQNEIIQAIARLKDKYTNSKLILVGSGPDEASIKELIKNSGLVDRVLMLGFRKDIIQILRASDAFIFASETEGSPNSVIEATLAGLPVIVSEIPANREAVKPEELANYFSVGDIDGIVRGIDSLMRDLSKAKSNADKLRQMNQNRFSIQESIRCYQCLYRQLAES
jgi:glycosyltransferase involved in cell wall biosynthesis